MWDPELEAITEKGYGGGGRNSGYSLEVEAVGFDSRLEVGEMRT